MQICMYVYTVYYSSTNYWIQYSEFYHFFVFLSDCEQRRLFKKCVTLALMQQAICRVTCNFNYQIKVVSSKKVQYLSTTCGGVEVAENGNTKVS